MLRMQNQMKRSKCIEKHEALQVHKINTWFVFPRNAYNCTTSLPTLICIYTHIYNPKFVSMSHPFFLHSTSGMIWWCLIGWLPEIQKIKNLHPSSFLHFCELHVVYGTHVCNNFTQQFMCHSHHVSAFNYGSYILFYIILHHHINLIGRK